MVTPYDPTWPEQLWKAGYTIRGGKPEKTIDQQEIASQGPCGCQGCAGPDDSIPAGFKYKIRLTLDIEMRANPKQSWDYVKILLDNAITTGRQQKYDTSRYREYEGKHLLELENGSKAMMDLLRTNAVWPTYVGYDGAPITQNPLDWSQTEQTFNQLSNQTPLCRDVMQNVRSFVGV